MAKMTIIQLLDGTYMVSDDTLACMNVPQDHYLGRTKKGFATVVQYIRGDLDEFPIAHLEELYFHGLRDCESSTTTIYKFNIGGTHFHVRDAIVKQSSYLSSLVSWSQIEKTDRYVDLTSTFIDRDPDIFADVLRFLESGETPSFGHNVAAFYGIDTAFPALPASPALKEVTDTRGALMSLVARGVQDTVLTSDYYHPNAYMKNSPVKYPKTSMGFATCKMKQKLPGQWTHVVKTNTCDMIGDAYLYIDLHTRPDSITDIFHVIKKISFNVSNICVEQLTGDQLKILLNGRIHMVSADTETRVCVPLMFYWFGKRHAYPIVCGVSGDQSFSFKVEACNDKVTCMSISHKQIYFDTYERQMRYRQRGFDMLIYKHNGFSEHVDVAQSGQTLRLNTGKNLNNLSTDLVVYIKRIDTTEKRNQNNALQFIQLECCEQIVCSLNSHMARTVIPRDMYGITDNQEDIYYIPFDNNTDMKNTYDVVSSLNFSRLDPVFLILTFNDPGSYDVIYMTRDLAVMKYDEGSVTVQWG